MSVNNITKKLLVISFGEEILNIGFSDKDKITYFETNKFYLLNSEISSFDLIIFDNRGNELNKFINTFTFHLVQEPNYLAFGSSILFG